MSAPMDPLHALIDRLYARGVYSDDCPPWPPELADALWLARFLPGGAEPESPAPEAVANDEPKPPDTGAKQSDGTDGTKPEIAAAGSGHPPPGPSRRQQAETAEAELRVPEGQHNTAGRRGDKPGSGSGSGPAATTLRVARPGLLAEPLQVARALRPLLQRLPSRSRWVLDEPATVHNLAELRLPVPVLRGAPERRWELAVVIDKHDSTVLWQPLLAELTELLARLGAFRDLRLWRLDTGGKDPVRLLPGLGDNRTGGAPRSPKVLRDPLGRRAVLVVSDFSTAGWRRGRSPNPKAEPHPLDVLADWQRTQPVVVLHLMPPARWPRSAFGIAELVGLRAAPPAQPDHRPAPLTLPVIGTDPPSLSAWARLVAGRAGAMPTGVRFPAGSPPQPPVRPDARTDPRPTEPDARERLRRFMAGASEPARALVLACAGVPLTLPVVRLVQEAAGIDPNPAALAELFLTGLLRPIREQPSAAPSPLARIYDFPPGVRQLLIDQSDPAEMRELLRRIGRLIERRMGSTRDFLARWLDPDRPVDTGGAEPLFEPFARIRLKVLRRLGGHYLEGEAARLAAWLERPEPPPRPDLLLLAETQEIADALLATYRERFGPAGREPEPFSAGGQRYWDLGQFLGSDVVLAGPFGAVGADVGGQVRRVLETLTPGAALVLAIPDPGAVTSRDDASLTIALEYRCFPRLDPTGPKTRAFRPNKSILHWLSLGFDRPLGSRTDARTYYGGTVGGGIVGVCAESSAPWGLLYSRADDDMLARFTLDLVELVPRGPWPFRDDFADRSGPGPEIVWLPGTLSIGGPGDAGENIKPRGLEISLDEATGPRREIAADPEVFDCFLSYNAVDRPGVLMLAEELRSRGVSIWMDQEQLLPGLPIQPALETGLRSSRSIAVLVGSAGLDPSQWEELRVLMSVAELDVNRQAVIPVLLPDAPAKPALPAFLAMRKWADLRKTSEAGGISELDRLISAIKWSPPVVLDEPALDVIGESGTQDLRLRRYSIGKYPVTVGEFRRFVEAGGYVTDAESGDGSSVLIKENWRRIADASWRRPYLAQDDAHPVVCVSWNDAIAYCAWLSGCTGQEYRLPTEAEWEFACRSGSDSAYCFGDDQATLYEYAWFEQNSGRTTHPVGQKRPNAWGIYDMHGLVFEWCADGENRLKSASHENLRAYRGGAWSNPAIECESRDWHVEDLHARNSRRGFRVVRIGLPGLSLITSPGARRDHTLDAGSVTLPIDRSFEEPGNDAQQSDGDDAPTTASWTPMPPAIRRSTPVEGDDFFGRETECEDLWRYLADDNILLIGPRRIGKTSLLRRIEDESSGQGHLGLFVDMEGCNTPAAFIAILDRIVTNAGITGELQGAANGGIEVQAPPEAGWTEAARRLRARLSAQSILLLLDEFSVFLEHALAKDRADTVGLLSWLRDWRTQLRPTCRFVFSGSPRLDGLLARHGLRYFFNDVIVFKLGPFSEQQALQMLGVAGEREGWAVTAETLKYLCDRVGWLSPFYLNLLLDSTIRAASDRVQQSSAAVHQLTRSDVDDGSNRLIAERPPFSHWYDHLKYDLDLADLAFALRILGAVATSKTGLTRRQLLARLARLEPDPDRRAARLHQAILYLEEDGYLDASGGRIQFPSSILRDYWRRHHVR
jgi:formylglycine-generating enzyme required for sulfatase activity